VRKYGVDWIKLSQVKTQLPPFINRLVAYRCPGFLECIRDW